MLGSPVANAECVHEPFSPVQVCNDGSGEYAQPVKPNSPPVLSEEELQVKRSMGNRFWFRECQERLAEAWLNLFPATPSFSKYYLRKRRERFARPWGQLCEEPGLR
jgi:hypothetical protein